MSEAEDRYETAAHDALRALTPEVPSNELRERVRGEFLAAAAPAGRRVRRGRVAAVFAALAASIALIVYGSLPRAQWTITSVQEPGGVLVDGESPVVGATLRRAEIQTSETAEVEVGLGDHLRLRFVAGAKASLPGGPGRWFGKERTVVLEQGEIFGSTGGEALGFTLRFETDLAVAALTGTTFAAIRLDDAACFCLYSGELVITRRSDGQRIDLPVGQRVFVFDDGRPPEFAPLDAREQMKLEMMYQQGRLR